MEIVVDLEVEEFEMDEDVELLKRSSEERVDEMIDYERLELGGRLLEFGSRELGLVMRSVLPRVGTGNEARALVGSTVQSEQLGVAAALLC